MNIIEQTPRVGGHSPWGAIDCAKVIAPGIVLVGTPSHGGYWISQARRQAMPETLRAIPSFAGGNWYEEDCDVTLVILAFPEEFADFNVLMAVECARGWHARAARYLDSEPARPMVNRVMAYKAAHGAKFTDAGGSSGPNGTWTQRVRNLAGTERASIEWDHHGGNLYQPTGMYALPAPLFTLEDARRLGGRVRIEEETHAF